MAVIQKQCRRYCTNLRCRNGRHYVFYFNYTILEPGFLFTHP
jgi:hypothetical protein